MSADTLTRARTSRTRALPTAPSTGVLVLRLALGAILIAHGAQKIFQFGLAGASESFASMGIPLASVAAPVVAYVELIGGVAIVVGFATRIAAALAAVTLLVATFVVHLPFGIFVADNGFELTLALAAVCIALVATGAGKLSIDALLARRR